MSITGWFWTLITVLMSALFWVAVVEWSPPAAAGYIAGTVVTLVVVMVMSDGPATSTDATVHVHPAGAHPTLSPRVGAGTTSTGAAAGPDHRTPPRSPVRSGDNVGRTDPPSVSWLTGEGSQDTEHPLWGRP